MTSIIHLPRLLLRPLWGWQLRLRMRHWQRTLAAVDQRLRGSCTAGELSADAARLAQLELRLAHMASPPQLRNELSRLRLHVAHMLDRISRRQRQPLIVPRRVA